jgi:hypothetical protein
MLFFLHDVEGQKKQNARIVVETSNPGACMTKNRQPPKHHPRSAVAGYPAFYCGGVYDASPNQGRCDELSSLDPIGDTCSRSPTGDLSSSHPHRRADLS